MQTPEAQTRVAGTRAGLARRRARLQRPPFFLLWPSLILLLGIVGIPFLISIYTSLTGLDQYTIAHWTSAPFVGLQNYIDGFTKGNALGASLPGSIWASFSFSVVTTLVILPIGVVAALLMNTPFPGRGVVRSIAVDSASIKETAAKLAMSEGAVRVALHRGLSSLATKLKGD